MRIIVITSDYTVHYHPIKYLILIQSDDSPAPDTIVEKITDILNAMQMYSDWVYVAAHILKKEIWNMKLEHLDSWHEIRSGTCEFLELYGED